MVYLGSTRDKEFVAEMDRHGLGECWVAGGGASSPRSKRFIVDNGAFGAWIAKEQWDADRFMAGLSRLDRLPDFIVCPDKPAEGNDSLEFSLRWVDRVGAHGPLALAVQDGMSAALVEQTLSKRIFAGLFVGGTTKWKWQSAPLWCSMARSTGHLCHIGRAATPRGIRRAAEIGATSIDGNQALWSRPHFARMLRMLDHVGEQIHFA